MVIFYSCSVRITDKVVLYKGNKEIKNVKELLLCGYHYEGVEFDEDLCEYSHKPVIPTRIYLDKGFIYVKDTINNEIEDVVELELIEGIRVYFNGFYYEKGTSLTMFLRQNKDLGVKIFPKDATVVASYYNDSMSYDFEFKDSKLTRIALYRIC
jgi:hypothetical protein